ncbi:hypothetical protein VCR31J2_1270495 [Vibrio coralliirubri]|uniref:Uncharacterized protein n=1 Tax=Vibrio coralliirubri TaxID=1516159 RepID=A0AA87C0V5_9VIBR|nr:hypothetical protein VCR31J2_1270495 [Vibrio coralliirubri]
MRDSSGEMRKDLRANERFESRDTKRLRADTGYEWRDTKRFKSGYGIREARYEEI